MANAEIQKDLKALENLLTEAERLYFENGRGDYEAGRIDGVKWCIEVFKKATE